MTAPHASHARMKTGAALLGLLFISVYFSGVFAQDSLFIKPTAPFRIIAQKMSLHESRKTDPNLQIRFQARPIELANNPNYPLTQQEFDRRVREYNKPVGQQIVDDVISNAADRILYPKKYKRRAQVPRF